MKKREDFGVGGRLGLAFFMVARLFLWVIFLWSWQGCAPGKQASGAGEHAVTLLGGIEYLGSRDEMGSPLRYEGTGYPLGLSYVGGADAEHFHEFSGVFSTSYLNATPLQAAISDGENHRAESVLARASYGQFFLVSRLLGSRFYVGGLWSNTVFFRTYWYAPNQMGQVEVWEATSSLDVAARLRIQPAARHRLVLGVGVPVVGYVLRPAYAVRGDERLRAVFDQGELLRGGRLATWNTLQMVHGMVEYGYQIAAHWRVESGYFLGMYRYLEPAVTRGLNHRLSVGIAYLF